jgi:hypothetical protein
MCFCVVGKCAKEILTRDKFAFLGKKFTAIVETRAFCKMDADNLPK